MSIILDALKRAQKDRTGLACPPAQTPFNPVIPIPKKSLPLFVLIPLVLIAAGGMGGIVYVKILKKMSSSHSAKPSAALPAPLPPLANNSRLKDEAHALFEKGDLEGSEKKWAELAKEAPEDAEAANNLGVVLKRKGDEAGAKEAYEKALSLRPDYPEALNNLGALLLKQGTLIEAGRLFDKAIALSSQYAEPHFHRGLLMEKQGKKTEAWQNYKKFLELSPALDSRLKGQLEMRLLTLEPQQGP